jgi:hypothetical protein
VQADREFESHPIRQPGEYPSFRFGFVPGCFWLFQPEISQQKLGANAVGLG